MIYIVKAVGYPFLKIGYSENIKSRLYAMSAQCPFELELLAERSGSSGLERDIHSCLGSFRIKNEWYKECDQVFAAFFRVLDPRPSCNTRKIWRETIIKEKDEYEKMFRLKPMGYQNFIDTTRMYPSSPPIECVLFDYMKPKA